MKKYLLLCHLSNNVIEKYMTINWSLLLQSVTCVLVENRVCFVPFYRTAWNTNVLFLHLSSPNWSMITAQSFRLRLEWTSLILRET